MRKPPTIKTECLVITLNGWPDEDQIILEAAMGALGQHVKNHGGLKKMRAFSAELRAETDPNQMPEMCQRQAHCQDEACDIWEWWTVHRKADQKRAEKLLMAGFSGRVFKHVPVEGTTLSEAVLLPVDEKVSAARDEYGRLEAKMDADEEAMLHRLIEIRGSLWT